MDDILKRLQTLEAREAKRRSRTRRTLRAVLLPLLIITPIAALALPTRNIFTAGDTISAGDVNQNFETLWTEVEALRAEVDATAPVREDLTVTVHPTDSADFQTIDAALASLDGRLFGSAVSVTIQLQDGSYSLEAPIVLDHPQGRQIRIVGNTGDPTKVILNLMDTRGVDLSQGRTLGYLSGLTLNCGGTARDGLSVASGASLHIGNININDCVEHGLVARQGASITRRSFSRDADGESDLGVALQGNSIGAEAAGSSYVALSHATAVGGREGFRANSNSSMSCSSCTTSGFAYLGFTSSRSSYLLINNSVASDPIAGANCSVTAGLGAVLEAGGVTATSTTAAAYCSNEESLLQVGGAGGDITALSGVGTFKGL